jgi:hypothetical protein
MVITHPNHELAAIIQRRENCSRAEPQNDTLTGTSPDALVADEYDGLRIHEPSARAGTVN